VEVIIPGGAGRKAEKRKDRVAAVLPDDRFRRLAAL